MKTTLKSAVEIWAISVCAELAVWESRPELQRLFRSSGTSGKLDGAMVVTALPGLSDSACRNLLRSVEHLRLVEANGTITELGKHCLESGKAPAWELGSFTFLVARHPCFGTWPIAFQREKADAQDRSFGGLEDVPDWFLPTPSAIWISGFDDPQWFTICDFPGLPGRVRKSRVVEKPAGRMVWEMNLATGKNLFHVEGEIAGADGKPLSFRCPGRSIEEAEVAAFYPTWEARWSAAEGRVLLPYDGGANHGRDDFVRSLTYPRVKAGGRGTFDSVTVDGVKVGPPGAPEARAWAAELALARVGAADGYVSPTAWAAAWGQTIAGTPLQARAGAVPDVSALLAQKTSLPARLRWLLATGTDLAMES